MKQFGNWRHISVDMQRMFSEETPWRVERMERILSQVLEIVDRFQERTIFTRFIPPRKPAEVVGSWQQYYNKWWMMTQEHLPAEMIDLLPELRRFVPPAVVFDKCAYSPWVDGRLHSCLMKESVTTLVMSGGESDVCVLATTLGGIDLGYRVVVLADAVCSSKDDTHEAALKLLSDRFSVQLEVLKTEDFLSVATV